jgi:hypothetical protein
MATKYGCKLKAGDVETAFLASEMDCEVWVKMPPFWGNRSDPITGVTSEQPPRRLLKGVPGIPQGSRLFYETFQAELKQMGYIPSKADKCLFLNQTVSERTAVLIWVDDFIFMCEKEQTWDKFLARLRQRFTIPNVGPLRSFLGMEILYNPEAKTMFVSQTSTIETLLERAGMSDCNPTPVPCQAGTTFSKKDCPDPPSAKSTEYSSLIALANFLACWTRPDNVIAFVVNKLCKFMANPGDVHWQALKNLLRYLRGTKSKGLCFNFGTSGNVKGVHGYSDSSHADCPDTSRSTLAYVFYYSGAVLSWYSKLHTFVTTCTNHSEYAALFLAAKEAQWLVYLFEELETGQALTPIPIFVDSSGVVSLVFNPVDHQSNKHVRIACHYARELAEEKIIAPQRIPAEHNMADIFTKPLAALLFKQLLPVSDPPTKST